MNEYEIYIRNKCVARGVVFPDKIMVYPDCLEKNKYKKLKETSEINFDYKNTVVYWTDKDIAESLNIEGINSADFILNHIENIVIEQVDKILTMTTTYKYINLCYSQDYMEHVLKDLMIRLDVADIRNVLVNLVKQRISIKDITYVFEKLNDYLIDAKILAQNNYQNQLKKDETDIKYLENLTEKIGVLYQMYKRVKNIKTQPLTAKIISDFLQKVSDEYPVQNNQLLLNEFICLWDKMKIHPLPQNRQEFEDRAELYTLLELIEEFL